VSEAETWRRVATKLVRERAELRGDLARAVARDYTRLRYRCAGWMDGGGTVNCSWTGIYKEAIAHEEETHHCVSPILDAS
jgi:hypothetical protein